MKENISKLNENQIIDFVYTKTIVQPIKGNYEWFGTTYNMNIYRGCNQGCIYCDSRSSCYQVKNFDTVRTKKDAPLIVEQELSSKRKKGIVGLGSMSDPYNVYERDLNYTRESLRAINKHKFGVFIVTKSDLILRDIDIFKKITNHSVCNIAITITTAKDNLQKRIERNVSSTSKRFDVVKELSDKGIYVGIMMMPILPFINDTIQNIESIVELANKANAKYIYPSFGVTLRDNQRDYFFDKIGEDLKKKYINTFGDSYMCVSPNYLVLKRHFEKLCRKYGILYRMSDIIKASKEYIKSTQMSLF